MRRRHGCRLQPSLGQLHEFSPIRRFGAFTISFRVKHGNGPRRALPSPQPPQYRPRTDAAATPDEALTDGQSSESSGRHRCRRGHPAAGADVGAALLPDARPPPQAAPGRSVCAGRASRRHRRALVLVHHARGQRPGTPQTRGSATSRGRRRPLSPEGAIGAAGRSPHRAGRDGRATAAGTCSASSSTTSGPIPHHMHQTRSRRRARPARASRRRTTSRRSSTRPTTTSPTRSWGSSRARPRTTSAAASRTGTRATTASSICRRPSPRARHRLADRSRHSARARLARDL